MPQDGLTLGAELDPAEGQRSGMGVEAGKPAGFTRSLLPGSRGSARSSLLTRGREFLTFRRMVAQMLAGPPLSAVDCEAALRERIALREAHFLDRMQRAVYENVRSPYR